MPFPWQQWLRERALAWRLYVYCLFFKRILRTSLFHEQGSGTKWRKHAILKPLYVKKLIIYGFDPMKCVGFTYSFSKLLICVQMYVVGCTTLGLLMICVLNTVIVRWGMMYKNCVPDLCLILMFIYVSTFTGKSSLTHNSLNTLINAVCVPRDLTWKSLHFFYQVVYLWVSCNKQQLLL